MTDIAISIQTRSLLVFTSKFPPSRVRTMYLDLRYARFIKAIVTLMKARANLFTLLVDRSIGSV